MSAPGVPVIHRVLRALRLLLLMLPTTTPHRTASRRARVRGDIISKRPRFDDGALVRVSCLRVQTVYFIGHRAGFHFGGFFSCLLLHAGTRVA